MHECGGVSFDGRTKGFNGFACGKPVSRRTDVHFSYTTTGTRCTSLFDSNEQVSLFFFFQCGTRTRQREQAGKCKDGMRASLIASVHASSGYGLL